MVSGGDLYRVQDTLIDYLNAYVSSNVSVTTGGTGIPLAKQSSYGGNIALTGSGYGFTAPRDGLYLIAMTLRTWRSSVADITMLWRRNAGGSFTGGSLSWAVYASIASTATGNFWHSSSIIQWLDGGDTLEGWVQGSASVSNFIISNPITSRITVSRIPGTPLTT